MNRQELDAFSAAHELTSHAITTALRLTGLRPGNQDWHHFWV
jgi:hypothetical protein